MSNKLAIFAPHIGATSETFIKRHMADLLPEQTVVIASTASKPYAGHWSVNAPALILDRIQLPSLQYRLIRKLKRKITGKQTDEKLKIVKRFLKEHQVNVAMGEFLNLSLPWLDIAQEMGIKFFGHAHGYDVSEQVLNPERCSQYLKYNDSGGVITMSHYSRKRLINIGLVPEKVHVVPYGTNVNLNPRSRMNEHEMVRCIAVGRMVPKKGPILLLDAFRRAANVNHKLHLDYIGGGELFSAAWQFIKAFKLENRIMLHGVQPNEIVKSMMKEADIFLQHSLTDIETGDQEGLPVAILEAMAHTLPIVSTRHAGISEAVDHGVNGYLVEEGDSEAMAERIMELASNAELRIKMGMAGWMIAKENFTWEREKSMLLKIMGLN
jgi:colanic acid/amylovoran biosynthesis glycosyltransferase